MSPDLGHDGDLPIEQYLDGRLSQADRQAFERQLEREPGLRAEIELQQAIDTSLRRSFEPPSAEALLARIKTAGVDESGVDGRLTATPRPAGSAPVKRRRLGPIGELAAAAVIAVLAVGGWWAYVAYRETHQPSSLTRLTLAEVYHEEERTGFEPDWECPPYVFARTFQSRLGQPLLLAAIPPGVESRGLAYDYVISRRTVYLVAEVDGRGVLVFADRADTADDPWIQAPEGLNLFKRQVGKLMLYEVTPLSEPRLLGLFYIPEELPPPPATQPGGRTDE